MRPKALIFDVFGTCVDWRTGVATAIAPAFAQHGITVEPARFAELWRAQYQPSMQPVRDGLRPYAVLDDLHRENLDRVLAETGLAGIFDEDARDQLAKAWECLPPWPDTVPGLTRLKQHVIIAPCSNGSIALMTRLARFAGLPWDCILGADLARNYKPHPSVYLASCAALRLDPGEVMMVAAHNDDLFAAASCGLQTAFLPRPSEHGPGQVTDLEATGHWDIHARDIADLAGLFTS